MEKQNQGLRVKKGKLTKLVVTHNGKDLTFLHPAYGPGIYVNVGEDIEKDGLLKPTMAETVSLVHAAFNSNNKYSKEIKKIMKNGWLWSFTGTLYVPEKGVYIQDNPKIKNGMPHMVESDLEKKLQKNDKSVRFVPFGYKIQKMSASELAKNDFVRGLAGEEGAEKLAKIADKYNNKEKPHLWSLESVNKPLISVSTVGLSWVLDVHGMGVCGYYHNGGWHCCALGVQKNTKKKK